MNSSEYSRVSGRLLRGLISEANAQAFQDLFWKIAPLAFDNFEKVKPQGKKGDEKNDGYRKGEGIFYQVYSPEKPQRNEQAAISKMVKDFQGLFNFWNDIEPVKEFNFVFNDKFSGSYPDLFKALADLQQSIPGITFNIFKADDLMRLFRELPPAIQLEVINLDCDEIILSYEALDKVATHLKSLIITDAKQTFLVAPDFEEKITFNKLNTVCAELLKKHYESISEVEKYFSEADDKELRSELQEKFTHLYDSAVKKYGEPVNENISDDIFMDILVCSSSHSVNNSIIRKAALCLMALYFGTCDIYNEPSK